MRPLPLEAGLQVLKAYNRCGSDWDSFAPSPSQRTRANAVGGQRVRHVLGEFDFIDTNDDIDTNDSDSEGEEYPFNWFDLVARNGPPLWMQGEE